jgi:hypothetical protein
VFLTLLPHHGKCCKYFIELSQGHPWGFKKTNKIPEQRSMNFKMFEKAKELLLFSLALTCGFSVG